MKKQSVMNAGRRSSRRFRIVGGKVVTDPNLYPWMTALAYRDQDPVEGQFCGGSLIAPNWVLTAAHCPSGEDAEDLDVILGFLKLDEPSKERIHVKEIIIHPKYDEDTSDFDIALLRLDKASKLNPIPLIPSGDPAKIAVPGKMATIIGWGALKEGGPGSKNLMHVEVPIVSNAEANRSYDGEVTKNMIAAGYIKVGGKDACQGDSGGPFVVKDENLNLVLAGTTSFGIGCAKRGYPGVYANLAVLGDWVRKTAGI
jgi:secreted trypsin-like serine protease